MDRLTGLVDKGKCTNIANLDFLKAFFLLLHDIWIKKTTLQKELSGHTLGGLKSVSDRSHHVVVTGETAEDGAVLSRVPRGICSCCNIYMFLYSDQCDHKKSLMVKSAGDAVTGRDVNNEQARLLL